MVERRPARNIIRGWDSMRAVTGYGRTQLADKIAAGEFPAPVKLGPRAVGWFEDEIADWQDRLVAGRNR